VLTDRAERFLVAELVREQLFHLLSQELPYSVTVSIDDWQERPPKQEGERGVVVIEATIHVAKEAHKRIVVGERGRMVRDVGARSRFEIERLLDTKVHLSLFVRVDEGWTESERALRELGYDSDA
jgi:GTP-binding protein Era